MVMSLISVHTFLQTHNLFCPYHFLSLICVMLHLQNTFFLHKFPLLLFIFRIFSYHSVSFGDSSIFVQIHAKTHGYFKVFKSVSIHIQVSKNLTYFIWNRTGTSSEFDPSLWYTALFNIC